MRSLQKAYFLCLCLIANKHFAFPSTKVSASEVPAILKNFFRSQKRRLWRPLFWNCLSSQVVFMWRHSVQLGIGRKEKNLQLTLHPPHVQEIPFSLFQANIHFTIFSAIILEVRACLTQNNFIMAQWLIMACRKPFGQNLLDGLTCWKCCMAAQYYSKWWQRCWILGFFRGDQFYKEKEHLRGWNFGEWLNLIQKYTIHFFGVTFSFKTGTGQHNNDLHKSISLDKPY